MADEYQAPDLCDVPWTLVRVTRGGQEKRVFRRDEAGSAELKLLESRVDAVAARISSSRLRCECSRCGLEQPWPGPAVPDRPQ